VHCNKTVEMLYLCFVITIAMG